MISECHYMKVYKQRYLLCTAVLNCCVFLLFCFFIGWAQTSLSATISNNGNLTPQNLTCHLSQGKHIANSPFQIPSQSVPNSNGPEDSDENELDDNFDGNWNPLIWKNSPENVFDISCPVKSHFFETIQSVQSRPTVPLFILYHSWKIFLF